MSHHLCKGQGPERYSVCAESGNESVKDQMPFAEEIFLSLSMDNFGEVAYS